MNINNTFRGILLSGLVALFGCATVETPNSNFPRKAEKVESIESLESIVGEPIQFVISVSNKDTSKIYEYVNKEGNLVKYTLQKEGIPNYSTRVFGFKIISQCICDKEICKITFYGYKIKNKGDLYRVFDLDGKVLAEGEFLVKDGNRVYATTRGITKKMPLKD